MKLYTSLADFLQGCSSSLFKIVVSSVLAANKYMRWNFVSASEDGDILKAEFVSQEEGSDFAQCLSCLIDKTGFYNYISTQTPASVVTPGQFA